MSWITINKHPDSLVSLEDGRVVLILTSGLVLPAYRYNGNWYAWENRRKHDGLITGEVEAWCMFPLHVQQTKTLRSKRHEDSSGMSSGYSFSSNREYDDLEKIH